MNLKFSMTRIRIHICQKILVEKTSVSDPDSDPCGSVLEWLPWIRIRIGNTDPDPGESKWCPKREKIYDFKLKRALTMLLRAWWF